MEKFKKVKTLSDIKKDPRVQIIEKEMDEKFSWWCYLKAGWQWDENNQHIIHEDTIKEICFELNNSVTIWENDPDLKR